MPASDVSLCTVSAATVRGLVDEQFPAWRDRPIQVLASSGTVNSVARIGDDLVARFPLARDEPAPARRRLEAEMRAARILLGRTRFPTPAPVAMGEPGAGYPLPWSVQTWLRGKVAADQDPGASTGFAHDLAAFIRDVRAIDTGGRQFGGGGRGGELRAHDTWMQTCFGNSDELLDVPRLRRLWRTLRALPRTGADVMTHGDLIPGNVLVDGGRLVGVVDVGGLGPADPALDLVGAWHLLDTGPRAVLRDDLGCDDLEWARGAAWAFEQAMGVVWHYADTNPAMSRMGRRTLERIRADLPGSAIPR